MRADAESSCPESRTDSWSPDGARNPWSAPTTELWAPTPKREDGESHNATYKNRLDHARVRSIGRIRNQLNLLAFQMNENDKARYAHFWRTGDEEGYDKRFTYRPERLTEPLLKAA